MSSFLLRCEAIESRMTSFPCPLGTSGRVHSLRLQRSIQINKHRQSRFATVSDAVARDEGSSSDAYNGVALSYNQRSHTNSDGVVIGNQPIRARNNNRAKPELREQKFPFRKAGIPELGRLRISGGAQNALEQVENDEYVPLANVEPAYLITRLETALRFGNGQHLVHEMLRQVRTIGSERYAREVLATIPATTFSEILNAVDPKGLVGRFSRLYEEISPAWARVLRLPPVNDQGHHEFLARFMKHISIILSSREAAYPLRLQDFRLLLKCARATGDVEAAKFIWHRLQNHIYQQTIIAEEDAQREIPSIDVECYNHYMAALCWSDITNPFQRQAVRITNRNLKLRDPKVNTTKFSHAGHRVGPSGLKSTVASIFQRMIQGKVRPNEETFCLMIVSVAREGELDAISSMLSRAWGIDVDAVLAGEESADMQPKHYDASDPLRPSTHLLMTLAHTYAINNSISAAIQLVDYVSRQYDLAISRDVWTELLERTVMLSSKHSPPEPVQLPYIAVSNLFKTMTAKPYNIQPDLRMYDALMRSLLKQQRIGQFQGHMQEVLKIHHADTTKLSRYITLLDGSDPASTSADILAKRSRDVAYQHLRVKVNRQYIRSWVRRWLHSGSASLGRTWHATSFASQDIPNMIEKCASFLPAVVKYKAPTGLVELRSQSREVNFTRQLAFSRRDRIILQLRQRKQSVLGSIVNKQRMQQRLISVGIPMSFAQRRRTLSGRAVARLGKLTGGLEGGSHNSEDVATSQSHA